ncbi:MAG TPA: hypothetical protein VGH54_29555 [Mycobacterium sp.]|jgi:hypothetical protein|uniref:hypothetical protein n=1 Tax=Mycobacterium sp. TaxID=1785 RepID=UPI002F408896
MPETATEARWTEAGSVEAGGQKLTCWHAPGVVRLKVTDAPPEDGSAAAEVVLDLGGEARDAVMHLFAAAELGAEREAGR